MPHLHVNTFAAPLLPCKEGEIGFEFIATNVRHSGEKLIATTYEGQEFFLLFNRVENKTLLKSDKITRPSPNYLVKHALSAYAKASGMEVLASNIDEGKNVHLSHDNALRTIRDFINDFPTGREIQIEIGFGSGRHLLHQAQNHPDVRFIGIEIHKASIEQVLKQIVIKKLDNVLVLDYDARLFLEFVPSNVVGKIFVHFPVPWDKKPHRRVISPSFIDEAERVLKKGGRLELRTDSDNYYQFSFETFTARSQVSLEIHKNRDIGVSSKYEDRWKRMEKNIYDITMICNSESPPLRQDIVFEFSIPLPDETLLLGLNGMTRRFEGGFVHFERLYAIEQGGYLFRMAMGSSDRPEHLYLILDDRGIRYYPEAPVASRANYEAHLLLCEMLHG